MYVRLLCKWCFTLLYYTYQLLCSYYDISLPISDSYFHIKLYKTHNYNTSSLKYIIHYIGAAMPMPPELMELYTLYQQELETSSKNEKETKLISDLNIMMRVKK